MRSDHIYYSSFSKWLPFKSFSQQAQEKAVSLHSQKGEKNTALSRNTAKTMFFGQNIYGFSKSIVILSTQTKKTAALVLVHSNLVVTFLRQKILHFQTEVGKLPNIWEHSNRSYYFPFESPELLLQLGVTLHLHPFSFSFLSFFFPYPAQNSVPSSSLLFDFHPRHFISLLMGNSASFALPSWSLPLTPISVHIKQGISNAKQSWQVQQEIWALGWM